MLSPSLLTKLFNGIQESFDFNSAKEITFEANPATFTHKKAQLFKDLGITRISLGIQAFADNTLKTLGREHTRQQAIDSVKVLQDIVIPEVNIDLMFAIPGQSIDEWQETIETAISLTPNHISCYNLTYEEDTEFIEKLTKGEFQEDDEDNARYFTLCDELLTKAGFLHYETSNYAQPGYQSRHNQGYWQGNDYLGIGPSAVGTVNRERYRNVPDTNKYIQMIQSVGHARQEIEVLDDEAFRIERIALQLRTSQGLPQKWITDSPKDELNLLQQENLIAIENGHLKLINDGRLLVDSIAERLV